MSEHLSKPVYPQDLIQGMLDASIYGVMLLEPMYNNGNTIADFTVKAANKAIVEHAGIQQTDALNMLISQLFPAYREFGFFKLYIDVLANQKATRKELSYKDHRLSGWYDVGVAPNADGLVVTFANITNYRLYQKQIETSAKQLDAIINTSQSGIFLFSPWYNEAGELTDFIFEKANPAFSSYVGQSPDALIGSLGSKWFPAYTKNGLFELYSETYVTGKTNRFDFHYDDDGIDVWLDILSTKLDDGVLVTFTDYTRAKRLQLELQETVDELKQSNANLEEFAYVASHDLQEPLRKIQYFADRLKRLASADDAEQFINRLEAATKRMQTLIDELLSYSKFSFNKNPFQKVDLTQLVKEVLEDLTHL